MSADKLGGIDVDLQQLVGGWLLPLYYFFDLFFKVVISLLFSPYITVVIAHWGLHHILLNNLRWWDTRPERLVLRERVLRLKGVLLCCYDAGALEYLTLNGSFLIYLIRKVQEFNSILLFIASCVVIYDVLLIEIVGVAGVFYRRNHELIIVLIIKYSGLQ